MDEKNEERLAPDGLPKHFKIEWNEPFSVSTGSTPGSYSSVSIPVDSTKLKSAKINTGGSGGVIFEDTPVYKFKTTNLKIKDGNSWAHVRTKVDSRGDYIDVIFGNSINPRHSHIGFELSAPLFLEMRNKGTINTESAAEEGVGVTAGSLSLKDTPTGKLVRLDFALNLSSNEIEITDFIFI
ncbi:MAG: hypothetical protein WC817_02990 [Patescibacteria group bacterium]|jgi:hypothetical protein